MADFQSFYNKLRKGYKKNYREYFALKNRLYPQFVFDDNIKSINDEIPVFTLHSVNPIKFEEQLKFLSVNGYSTLKADEFYQCLIGEKKIEERTILLTFDDGWKNFYTVVYPLLTKYNFAAICFIIPSLISEKVSADLASKDFDQKNFQSIIPDSKELCSWKEINEMHKNGIIDFQSHSLNHCLIYTSDKIVDFLHPKFDSYAMNLDVPLIRFNGQENYSRDVKLGTPVYEHSSRFSSKRRYFDDEILRFECTEYVRLNGGDDFFKRFDWRKKLQNIVDNYYKKQKSYEGLYETDNEQKESIFNEFRDSKLLIENKLPDKSVNHFCYPWWEGSELASAISKEAGYLSNFWGVFHEKRTNKMADNPYKISRILSEDFIYRLPGHGRKTLSKIIFEKFSSKYNQISDKLLSPVNRIKEI